MSKQFALYLKPITYDYNDEDIVYRIYVNDQLIVERALPPLEYNQGLSEEFILDDIDDKFYKINFVMVKPETQLKLVKLYVNGNLLYEINRVIPTITFNNLFQQFENSYIMLTC